MCSMLMVCHKETRLFSHQDDDPFVDAHTPLQFVAGIVALYTGHESVLVPPLYTLHEYATVLDQAAMVLQQPPTCRYQR